MKKLLLTVSVLLNVLIIQAQVQETWAYSHLGQLQDQVVDANGNVYTTGRVYSTNQVEGNLTIKHDRNGNEVWRHFQPWFVTATSMAVDASGNVYVAGASGYSYIQSSVSEIEVDPETRFYLLKIGSNGTFQWSNVYTEDDYGVYGYPHDVAVDYNGNPYATGVIYEGFINPVDHPHGYPDSATADFITIKYDAATGNRYWVKRYNGSTPGTGFDEARGLAIDELGYLYVAGTSQFNGELDVATIKYDPAGNQVWVSRYSNPDANYKNDFARDVQIDKNGNVIVGGFSHRLTGVAHKTLLIKYTFTGFQLWVRQPLTNVFTSQFGPPLYYNTNFIIDNANNIIDVSLVNVDNTITSGLAKYNPAGDLQWTLQRSSDALAVDGDNNIYVVWTGIVDMYTTKISPGGTELWSKTYPWPGGNHGWVGVDSDNNVYASDGYNSSGTLNSTYVTVRYSQCQLSCPEDITVNAPAGGCSAIVTYPEVTTSGSCGSEIIYSHQSGSSFPVGTTTVTVTSTETGATCTFNVTVLDNELPVITNCPSNKTVSTDAGVCYASAASVNAGTATATDNCNVTVTPVRSDGLTMTDNFPAGITTITWSAVDAGNNTVTCIQTITVVDNTDPVISNTIISKSVLSPPNHKMVDISLDYVVTDNCGATTTVTCASDELETGLSNGDLGPDIVKIDDKHWQLRAERDGKGDGRVYTFTITATDGSNNTSTSILTVVVAHNIASPHSGAAAKVGSTVNFSGTFWDVAGSKHTAKWVIDGSTSVKGSVTEPSGMKNGKVTGSYRFNSPGVYKLRMDITDINGVTTSTSTNGDLESIVVVYDPNGGYTYGGGNFASPQGALKKDPGATGDVSFGYTVNYYKTATYPKGETQFNFQVGNFDFNAVNFDYLMIGDALAQFKGTGRITGGQSGINFIMTVIDGERDGTGVDKVRMKIYNKNTDEIYYDSQPGASDADNPTTIVGENSVIVIAGNKPAATRRQEVMFQESTQFATEFSVKAYPNPFNKQFGLAIITPVSGMATIEFYTITGARVHVERKQLIAGAENTLLYPNLNRFGNLLYKITLADYRATGKLVKQE